MTTLRTKNRKKQMTVIQIVSTGLKVYRIAKKGYKKYDSYNYKYNPIAKFESRLPPGYRKPYKIGLRIGDAVLSGGIIYDAMRMVNDAPTSGTSAKTGYQQKNRKYLQRTSYRSKYNQEKDICSRRRRRYF